MLCGNIILKRVVKNWGVNWIQLAENKVQRRFIFGLAELVVISTGL